MDLSLSDQERFLTLLNTHRRSLLKVCWTYGLTSHDRDDLLQEIVSRLWSSFERYDPDREFATWMYRVALNVAIDFYRKQRRRSRETSSLDDDEMATVALTTDSSDRVRQLEELRELIEQRGDSDRALLLLHLENRSHSEIGEILGISESNVGTRLSRLKKSLRRSARQCPGE